MNKSLNKGIQWLGHTSHIPHKYESVVLHIFQQFDSWQKAESNQRFDVGPNPAEELPMIVCNWTDRESVKYIQTKEKLMISKINGRIKSALKICFSENIHNNMWTCHKFPRKIANI